MIWNRIASFVRYYLKAKTKYNVQSTFLYDFIVHVLDTDKEYYVFAKIEEQRKWLLSIKTKITKIDFGAKRIQKQKPISISSIAKKTLSSEKKCRLIFNTIQRYRSKNIIELGTSLGISAAYMASVANDSKVVTIDGDSQIISYASMVHKNLDIQNITILNGHFDEILAKALDVSKKYDLIYIDGNHSMEPTIRYFETLLPVCHNDSIFILDDINWSPDMTLAWDYIKAHPKTTLSIDLYGVGFIFLKKELSKQDFVYISYKFKPWCIGLFG